MTPQAHLDALRVRHHARAAGLWRVVGDHLRLVAFSPAPDLPDDVTRGFAEATRTVPVDRLDLAIAHAAATSRFVMFRAEDLPADVGSGLWLRRFQAARSVAVPLLVGETPSVVSIALMELEPEGELIAKAIRDEVATWSPFNDLGAVPGTGR